LANLLLCAVKVEIKARKVTVTGPRGKIVKDLSHIQLDIRKMKLATKHRKGDYVRIQMWNGKYKHACGVTTIKTLINNMFIGVTQVSLRRKATARLECPFNSLTFYFKITITLIINDYRASDIK